jgi:ribonuclease Z
MSKRDLIIFGTSAQHPTRDRNHGGYLFRWNGQGFLCDPGEGTQRQFIFANVPPTQVTRILISHFHGDHCLGVGSMLMRLNLDGVKEVHCYYPASGKKYFDRLRYGTIYHDSIKVIEHPVEQEGLVHDDGEFTIEAYRLDHGYIENFGWRIKEADEIKFYKEKLAALGIKGPAVTELKNKGSLTVGGKTVLLEEVAYTRKGDAVGVVIDTRPCPGALKIAAGARLLLSESTYLEPEKKLAKDHFHLTAKEAAEMAKTAGAQELILTHFSARYTSLKAFEEEAGKIFPNVHAAKDLDVYDFPKK